MVIVFFLSRAAAGNRPSVSFTISLPGRPPHVELVSPTGSHWELPSQYGGGRLQVAAPLRTGVDVCPQCGWIEGYLVVDQ